MSNKVPKDRGAHSRHLWVGAFQSKVAAKDIAQYFERFGPLESINVKENYAFVNYRKISSAVKALEALNGAEMLGSKVSVKYTEGVPTRMLWIGSLPPGVTEQELKERFQRFGSSFVSARIFRKTNSATIFYGKIEDARLAYKQSKNMELRGQHVKIDYGVEPDRGKPKSRREKREEGESDDEYNYRTEEGLDPNLRFTITIPNNDPPYDPPPQEVDMNMNLQQQDQVDPQLLQQVVQSLLGSSGVPLDQSQLAGVMPDGVNGALPTLDPTFLAQLQDTISQAGLFNTANNLNALVSNTALPDVSRFFPVEDNNNRGRFYPTDEANERHEEHRHGRDEDYYYDRERLIDRNLSRFYNNERDRNYSRDSHRNEPRGSSPPQRSEPRGSTPPRDSHRSEPRSRSPSRRSRTPPRDPSQLSEEDLLVQARRAVEAGRKDRAEESRGQKRSSPDNISDRPEKRQKTSADSTPTKTSTTSDKNKSTNSSESSKSDSLRKSAGKSSNTNVTITVTANGPVDSTTTSTPSTTSSSTNTASSSKPSEVPKTNSASATKSTAPGANSPTTTKTTSSNTTKTTTSQSNNSTKASTSSGSQPTNGTAVSSSDTGVRMEVDSRGGSAPSVTSSTNGSAAANSGPVTSPPSGSGGAKNGSTAIGTTTAVSGPVVSATGSSSSPSVQGGGSVTSSGGNVLSGQTNGAAPASKATTSANTTPSGAPKAPMAGKATATPTAPKPVVFVPVKPEPVRNNTNVVAQQQAVAPTVTASTASVPQTSSTASTQPSTTSAVVQTPSTSQSVQQPTNVQPVQATAQSTAASLLGVPANEKPSPVTSVPAPQTALVSNTNQLPPTSNPLAPPGLPPPVSSVPKSVALGFIKNMLEDNPVIPQPPSSPISPPRSPKRIDKPQVWHGYLAKRGTIVCDMVAYFLGGSDLWRKLSPMLDLKERTNLTNLTNFFPTDNTIKPSLLYLQPASKGETFKYASIHRYLKNIEKAGICLGEEDIYRIYVLPMTREEAIEFNIDDMALFALIVPRPKLLHQ